MAFNGSGIFSRLYSWATEQASSPIEISKLDTQEEDFATALSNCVLRDGTGKPTADQDWNGQDLTNVGALAATSVSVAGTAIVESGSFTGSFSGCTGAVTGTLYWKRTGHLVTLYSLTSITGTSNALTMSLSGIPAEIQPTVYQFSTLGRVTDNGGGVMATLYFSPSSGTAQFYTMLASSTLLSPTTAFTSTGGKGVPQDFSVTYLLV